MKKWIVEEDTRSVTTAFYAVEAETLEEAIDKTTDMEPLFTKVYPDDVCTHDDSHEATEEEWEYYNV